MTTESKPKKQTLYEQDYNLWVIETVKQLENKDYEAVDWKNLLEEIADLSRREKRKLETLLTRLFEHLLKLQYWQAEMENNQGHWEAEILNFRKQIKKELKASPSLKQHLFNVWDECYQDGRDIAAARSRLPLDTFPTQPIASLEELLDENWLPSNPHN
jgi:DNA repair ATPase RecN